MNNAQIAEVFDKISSLSQLKGESVFVIRAYQRAAHTIERSPVELEQYVGEGKDLKELDGIGDAIAKKIRELLDTGHLEFYETLKAEFPPGLLEIMDIPGVGPKTALRLVDELGVSTMDDLEQAIEDGRVEQMSRLGKKAADNILRHLRTLRTKDRRMPIGQASYTARSIMDALRRRSPSIQKLESAGSLRRFEETIGDIDLVCTATDPQSVIDALASLPEVTEVLGHGSTKGSIVTRDGVQVDLRVVEGESFGALLQYLTGSKQHNILLRDYANRMGLSVNEYGITTIATGDTETFADEGSFYARLGLPHIPPELRQGTSELDAARRKALPSLVMVEHLKGDLHIHTDWSDGTAPIEAMLAAATERGYEYIAITDHSSGRGIANGLSDERMLRQVQLLRTLDGQFNAMKVLTGSEVDIRADGSLDYPEEVLKELDVVVASIHSGMGQDRDKMTERIIKAIHNPYVTAIGHLTTRLLGQRPPIEVDVEAVLQAAKETGTGMEINSSLERLDLKDTHVFRARELGVPLVINTDAHAVESLDNTRYGVAVARRGWCEPHHVVNTRPLKEFLEFIRKKRVAHAP